MHDCHNRDFALILAAGFSTRMGTCKTSLPWRDRKTLLRYQAEQLIEANITPIIVLGSHNAHRQKDCPDGSQVVINECSERGKISSILTGLELLPKDFSSVTISAVDQPRSLYIYQTLLQTYRQKQALITAPCYQRKLGHPLLFSDRLLPELKNITEANLGLRQVVHKFYNSIAKVEFSTSEVISDLNTRDRYQLELSKYQVAKG